MVNIFLPIISNICFGAQENRLIEYPQKIFWLRKAQANMEETDGKRLL